MLNKNSLFEQKTYGRRVFVLQSDSLIFRIILVSDKNTQYVNEGEGLAQKQHQT